MESVAEEESGGSKIGVGARRRRTTRTAPCRAETRHAEVERMEGGAKTAETTTLTPFVYCS